ADADLLDGVGGIDGDLIVGLVAVFHPEVEIHQVDIEERVDQLVLDVLPDDPGHLVAIELQGGVRVGARHHVAGDEDSADQRAGQAGAGTPPGEGRDNGGYSEQRHELDGDDSGEGHEAGIGQRIEQVF